MDHNSTRGPNSHARRRAAKDAPAPSQPPSPPSGNTPQPLSPEALARFEQREEELRERSESMHEHMRWEQEEGYDYERSFVPRQERRSWQEATQQRAERWAREERVQESQKGDCERLRTQAEIEAEIAEHERRAQREEERRRAKKRKKRKKRGT